MGKPSWLFVMVVLKFYFLGLECIELGLGFGLLTKLPRHYSHLSLMASCLITVTELAAMSCQLVRWNMIAYPKQGRGLLGKDHEEHLKEPSQRKNRIHSSSQTFLWLFLQVPTSCNPLS